MSFKFIGRAEDAGTDVKVPCEDDEGKLGCRVTMEALQQLPSAMQRPSRRETFEANAEFFRQIASRLCELREWKYDKEWSERRILITLAHLR